MPENNEETIFEAEIDKYLENFPRTRKEKAERYFANLLHPVHCLIDSILEDDVERVNMWVVNAYSWLREIRKLYKQ